MTDLTPLSAVTEFIKNGLSVKQSKNAGGLPITRIETISHGEINPRKCGYAALDLSDVEGRLLHKGDILFSHINSLEHLGKTAIYEGNPTQLVHGMNLLSIRPDESKVAARYLLHILRSKDVNAQVLKAANKSVNQASISGTNVKGIKIRIPPLEEQKRIAKILDAAGALRTKCIESLVQFDSLLQSFFLGLFGDPGKNPLNWDVAKLKDVCDKITDGTHHSPPIVEEGIPYVTAKHIKKDGVKFFDNPWYVSPEEHKKIYSRCDPVEGDILYIKDGATTGIAAINRYDFEFSMLSSIALLRPKTNVITSDYLCSYLNNDKSKQRFLGDMGGAAIKRLTLSKIKKFDIPVPDMQAQERFSKVACRVKKQKELLTSQLASLDELFASLQQRAFSGEL